MPLYIFQNPQVLLMDLDVKYESVKLLQLFFVSSTVWMELIFKNYKIL